MLTQHQMLQYHNLRQVRLDYEVKARQIEKEEKAIKDEILFAIDGGEEQERGIFHARIDLGPRRPKWEKEFVQAMGEAAAEEVRANTPASRLLVVEAVEQIEANPEEAA